MKRIVAGLVSALLLVTIASAEHPQSVAADDIACSCVAFVRSVTHLPGGPGAAAGYTPAFMVKAGYKRVKPQAGAIVVWDAGAKGADPKLGHIAFVKAASQDPKTKVWTVKVRHSNWTHCTIGTSTFKWSDLKGLNFYLPKVAPAPPPPAPAPAPQPVPGPSPTPTNVAASIMSPQPGAALAFTQTFTWTSGTNASGYQLLFGSSPGSSDYGNFSGNVTATTISGFKAGFTVYLRLVTIFRAGPNQSNDYTYNTQSGGPTKSMTVPANLELGTTSWIWVEPGDVISETSSGTWCGSSFGTISTDCGGPDGLGRYDPHATVPSAPVGTLISRVGTDGRWVALGSHGSYISATSGLLDFAFNDVPGYYGDNSGYVTVSITVTNGH